MRIQFDSLWDLQQYIATAAMEQLRDNDNNFGTAGIIVDNDKETGDCIQCTDAGCHISNTKYANELGWLLKVYAHSGLGKDSNHLFLFDFPEVYSNFARVFIKNDHSVPYTAREMLLYINYEMMLRDSYIPNDNGK